MHPVFIELYQQYKKITTTRMYSMFSKDLDDLFIANRSLFEAWLPESSAFKAPLPLKTANLILAAANTSGFRWWCTTYNASVVEADKVLFLDNPYVKIWISILNATNGTLIEAEYSYVNRVNPDNINSLLAAATLLINNNMWRRSTIDVLFSSASMSPSLWDKQANAMIVLSKFNYITQIYASSYNEHFKDLFLPYIKKYLSDDRSWESFVKILKIIDDLLQVSIDKDESRYSSLYYLRNDYCSGYSEGSRTRLYKQLIDNVIPNIHGNLDELISVLDILVTEAVDVFIITDSYSIHKFSETFSILSLPPYNYKLNAYAYQHLHGHLSKDNIITIIQNSEGFGCQLVDALRIILHTHPDIVKSYNKSYICNVVVQMIQNESPYAYSIVPKVNILLDGIIAIKNSIDTRSINSPITDWLNLSPKNREILLPYIQQFSKHQLLTQELFAKLISFSELINRLPATCSLQDIPESLITKDAFKKVYDFFVMMDSITPGCSMILQDYLQEISDSKDVVVNKYFKGEETSEYEYRALKLFSTHNPFPIPTGSATDEESENDELAVDLGC